MFEAGEEYELPRGCDGVRRSSEQEPGAWEYVVVCPQVISERQAEIVFKGVSKLRHRVGRTYKWCIAKPQLLYMDFEECERHPGVFDPPVVPPGRPKSSKVKDDVPGCRLKALKFHRVTF